MAKEIKQYGTSERKVNPAQGKKPTTEEVEDFHTNSDVDLRAEALHHTLGTSPSQAAAGDHNHDGGNSALILEGRAITGSRDSDAWRLSVNALLVRLGADDNSTA
jgi:hypothetical protein